MGNIEDEHLTIKQIVSGGEQKVAGTVGRWSYFQASTNVKLGGWYNAAKSYMDFGSAGTGEITGFGSSFNSEMILPNKTTTGGSYTSLEVNLNFQASTVLHNNPALPTSIAHFKAGGTQAAIDAWEANPSSCVFSIQGLTSAANEIFDATQGPAAANASFKINISGTEYWVMLSTTAS